MALVTLFDRRYLCFVQIGIKALGVEGLIGHGL